MNNADIPVVILCGGMGTRLREASEKLPKPLVDIGGKPILWHVMKTYSHFGFRRFVLCLGYKSDLIRRYFLDYREHQNDFTLELASAEQPQWHGGSQLEDWEITFVDTGLLSGTGARVKRVAQYLDQDTFMLTYGDGIGAVDLDQLLANHAEGGRIGTVTGVHPASRYGEMHVEGNQVSEFNEKPTLATGWVSGGFFAFQREMVDRYLDDDPGLLLEHKPLRSLASDGELTINPHEGFWMGMDTFRDWTELNQLWDAGEAPWKVWED
ncbi:glucose-1-phosphate cytidylyltransferase [Nocardioides scoriae]|uniref:Glucose-1-phosphate cytidylyltransferase n=1 Tax=Nocardioides scoriae TaxID=642780 RepID=A0A1H1TGR4_9ACTN|nr:glucose-1-phosphate cytidylyltransferase [Nocardioides scoriae]SDS59443.1 glucose-1-phosphate cytidylyltransferase [Nocardioides scoriae]